MRKWTELLNSIFRFIGWTILILVLINSYIWAMGCVRDFLKQRNPLADLISDQGLKYIYPNHSKAEVNQIYNESWTRKFVFDEFVQFKERPFKGKYVNVSESGFRLVKNQGPWPPESQNRNIFIFGGSQAFNYGITDEETVASRLQEILRAQSGSSKTCVYNFGRGSYFSTQERILFEQLLIQGYVPDLALFIHGGNDFARLRTDLEFSEEIGHYLESNLIQRFLTLLSELPMVKLSSGIRLRLLASRAKYREKDPAVSPSADSSAIRSRYVKMVVTRANQYLNNIRMIDATAKAYNIEAAFFLAPVSFYGIDPKYDFFSHQKLQVKVLMGRGGYELMKTLYDLGRMQKNFIWLGDYAIHKKEPLFVDTGHYTAKFANEVAEVIVQKIAEKDLLPITKKTIGSNLAGQLLKDSRTKPAI